MSLLRARLTEEGHRTLIPALRLVRGRVRVRVRVWVWVRVRVWERGRGRVRGRVRARVRVRVAALRLVALRGKLLPLELHADVGAVIQPG